PAAAAGQHLALEVWSVEAAAVKMKKTSVAIRSIAESGCLNFKSNREQKPGVDLRHGGLTPVIDGATRHRVSSVTLCPSNGFRFARAIRFWRYRLKLHSFPAKFFRAIECAISR